MIMNSIHDHVYVFYFVRLFCAVSLVIKAGLDTALAGPGPFTVIAPTNEAFARLSAQTLNFLTSDAGKDSLTAILKYHAVSGAQVNSNQLVDGQQIQTLQGENLNAYVPANLSSVYFNYAKVVTADVLATNGVAHVIDHVVFPHAYFVQPTAPPLPPLSSSSLSSSSLSAVHQQVMTSSSVQLQERLSSARTIADYLTANSDKFSSLGLCFVLSSHLCLRHFASTIHFWFAFHSFQLAHSLKPT